MEVQTCHPVGGFNIFKVPSVCETLRRGLVYAAHPPCTHALGIPSIQGHHLPLCAFTVCLLWCINSHEKRQCHTKNKFSIFVFSSVVFGGETRDEWWQREWTGTVFQWDKVGPFDTSRASGWFIIGEHAQQYWLIGVQWKLLWNESESARVSCCQNDVATQSELNAGCPEAVGSSNEENKIRRYHSSARRSHQRTWWIFRVLCWPSSGAENRLVAFKFIDLPSLSGYRWMVGIVAR